MIPRVDNLLDSVDKRMVEHWSTLTGIVEVAETTTAIQQIATPISAVVLYGDLKQNTHIP